MFVEEKERNFYLPVFKWQVWYKKPMIIDKIINVFLVLNWNKYISLRKTCQRFDWSKLFYTYDEFINYLQKSWKFNISRKRISIIINFLDYILFKIRANSISCRSRYINSTWSININKISPVYGIHPSMEICREKINYRTFHRCPIGLISCVGMRFPRVLFGYLAEQ